MDDTEKQLSLMKFQIDDFRKSQDLLFNMHISLSNRLVLWQFFVVAATLTFLAVLIWG